MWTVSVCNVAEGIDYCNTCVGFGGENRAMQFITGISRNTQSKSDTLATLILASKSFTLLSLSGNLANFILATLVSLHYNIYKDRVKLATFKTSYVN